MANTLIINSIQRVTTEGVPERLDFTEGVNVLVGRKDTGKTRWLRMLDFLMGDPGTPDEAFGSKLAEKYTSLTADIVIKGKSIRLERRWKEPRSKGKIFIDDVAWNAADFSEFILKELAIPILHFPKGNPYAETSWPHLSWRMLYRHIYRQERFWGDIADQQPEKEQFAVLSQFLGFAEKLFSDQLGEQVKKRKQIFILQARKEQFQAIVDNITSKMTASEDTVQFATSDILNNRIAELETRVKALLDERNNVLRRAAEESSPKSEIISKDDIQLSERRSLLIAELSQLTERKATVDKRHSDLSLLLNSVSEELERLKRAQRAGTLLDDLKVTHCPSCDQKVNPHRATLGQCFLCLQPVDMAQGSERLEFEIHQMEAEKSELVELVSQLTQERSNLVRPISYAREQLSIIDRRLEPMKSKFGALVDPRISILDAERGRIEEQIENYGRLLSILGERDEITKKIDELSSEVSGLDSSVETLSNDLNLESASDALEDGLMTYLSQLNEGDSNRWTQGRVSAHITERNFSFKIHGRNWTGEIGGTSTCYFLLAYHHALMSLTSDDSYNYPGICIVDFPPSLPDGTSIADKENFLIEPFVTLCNHDVPKPRQVIVAGRSFKNLKGVNRIELHTRWTE